MSARLRVQLGERVVGDAAQQRIVADGGALPGGVNSAEGVSRAREQGA